MGVDSILDSDEDIIGEDHAGVALDPVSSIKQLGETDAIARSPAFALRLAECPGVPGTAVCGTHMFSSSGLGWVTATICFSTINGS